MQKIAANIFLCNGHVSISLFETINLKQLDEGCSLKFAGMCLKQHF